MGEKIIFINDYNEKLAGYLHKPKQETDKGIILAHCFTCSKHQRIMRELCDKLAENNFLVLRFDFSGNGESEGKFEDATYTKEMKDLAKAIDFIMSKGITKLGVLGHSMGSAVSILQSSEDDRVNSLCTLAGHSYTEGIKEVFPKETIEKIYSEGEAEVNIFGKQAIMKKEFFIDAERHNIQKALGKFTRPFCVIHGENDTIINVENAKKLHSYTAGEKEIHILPNTDHLFSTEESFKKVENFVIDWFKKTI